MKKMSGKCFLFLTVVIFAIVPILLACGSVSHKADVSIAREFNDAPDWLTKGEFGYICGIGAAKETGDPAFDHKLAEDRGRIVIAKNLEVQISTLLLDYWNESRDNTQLHYEAIAESIANHFVYQTIRMVEQVKEAWISPMGNIYKLMCITDDNFKNEYEDTINNQSDFSDQVKKDLLERGSKIIKTLDRNVFKE